MPNADESEAQDDSPGASSNRPSEPADGRRRRGSQGMAPAILRLTMIGWFVAMSIAVGTIAGWWLDTRLGTAPGFLIGGVLIGVGVALVGMVRMLQRVGTD